MFTELHSNLRWDQFSWKSGQTLVVLEDENADASFILHHLLSMVNKDSTLSSLLVSLQQTKGHYAAVSLKMGGNILKHGGRMKVVEVLKHIHEYYLGLDKEGKEMDFMSSGNLLGLYSQIEKDSSQSCLIMIDQLSVLQDLGVPKSEMVRFLHKLQRLVQKLSGTLVVVVREESSIGKFVGHISDYILQVSHLKTGYSFSVTGNLAFRWGDYSQDHIQYLSRDKNVQVFAKGMSSAVL